MPRISSAPSSISTSSPSTPPGLVRSAFEWECIRPEFTRLYREEDLPLKEVMKRLAAQGFVAQYVTVPGEFGNPSAWLTPLMRAAAKPHSIAKSNGGSSRRSSERPRRWR